MSQGRMENRLCQDVPGAPDRLDERLGSLWDVRFIEGRPPKRAPAARGVQRRLRAAAMPLGVRMRGPFACDGGTGFRQSCAQRCDIIDPLRDHGLRLLVQALSPG
jgi:hypothetical protein